MALRIRTSHLESIKGHGRDAYPVECCGFLLGKAVNGKKEVTATLPVKNTWKESEQVNRYLISPEDLLEGEKLARQRKVEIIGFYHSHPNAKAKPSAYDLEHGWPWYSYVIVAIRNKKAKEVTSWVMEDQRKKFHEETIIII